MKQVYVGLDVGSSSCHLVALSADGIKLLDRKIKTGERVLISVIEPIEGEVHVHLEASELAGWIRGILKPRVKRVVVGDPKANFWIARDPLKNDRLDAFKLAELLRMGRVHEVYYPDEQHRADFKRIVQHYDQLTHQASCLKVQIKARLRVAGVIARGESVYTTEGRRRFLDQVNSTSVRRSIEQLYELMDAAEKIQQEAKTLMKQESRRYPEIGRFQQVPGIGLIGACRFSAYIQTPYRFSTKRKLWRYCKLGITDRSSDGKPLGRKRLDSNGNGRLKDVSRHAFMGALCCKADNAFKRAYRRTLQRTHNKDHARLTVQRKIIATLRAIWKGGSSYQDDKG